MGSHGPSKPKPPAPPARRIDSYVEGSFLAESLFRRKRTGSMSDNNQVGQGLKFGLKDKLG